MVYTAEPGTEDAERLDMLLMLHPKRSDDQALRDEGAPEAEDELGQSPEFARE